MRTRNQTKFINIFVPYGHVLVTLRVSLWILQIVDIQEPVAHYSYKHPFQLVSVVLLIITVISQFVRILYELLLETGDLPLFLSLHHYN